MPAPPLFHTRYLYFFPFDVHTFFTLLTIFFFSIIEKQHCFILDTYFFSFDIHTFQTFRKLQSSNVASATTVLYSILIFLSFQCAHIFHCSLLTIFFPRPSNVVKQHCFDIYFFSIDIFTYFKRFVNGYARLNKY